MFNRQVIVEQSMVVKANGDSQAITVSGTSAQTNVFAHPGHVVVSPTVDVFVRAGTNPTALATGVDQFLFGGSAYRIHVDAGDRLAFIAVGAGGTVYVTPGA